MAGEIELARQLLRRAEDDEAAARAMFPVASVMDAIVGQHSQQAKQAGCPLPDELRDVDQLTPYAGAMRYDEDAEQPVPRETALSWASAAVA